MANSFKRYTAESVTTLATIHTAPAATETTVIGLSVANTSATAITASVLLGTTYIIKNAPIPVGSTLVAIGGDQKVVMEPTDTLRVEATGTVDTIASVLEITA